VADVLLNFLLMARRRDRSALRRLLFRSEQLLEAGVEQLVETACARVEVRTQREEISYPTVEKPASHRMGVRFYPEAEPDRPCFPDFEDRSQRFPLADTLSVFTCPGCSGTGTIRDIFCNGTGRASCSSCNGDGRHKRSDGSSRTCTSCRGSGKKDCWRCGGSGRVTHGRCEGEGQLASWTVETYRWRFEDQAEDTWPLPEPPKRLKRAFKRWLTREPDEIERFEPGAADLHLGYITPEVESVVFEARTSREQLERSARGTAGYLFHRTWRRLSPTAYTVIRLDGLARYYFVVGRGTDPEEARPAGRLDPWKSVSWLAVTGGLVLLGLFIATAVGTQILPLPFELAVLVLAGSGVAAAALALPGLTRMLRPLPPVRTVALLPSLDEPTSFLTCAAAVGSFAGRLRVVDRTYEAHLAELLGEGRSSRQSTNLTLEMEDGTVVRVVEVARPGTLTNPQRELLRCSVDGLVLLESSAAPCDELRSRFAWEDVPQATVRLDDDSCELPSGEGCSIPLEVIRQRFIERCDQEADWELVARTMWSAFDRVLEVDGPRLLPTPTEEGED